MIPLSDYYLVKQAQLLSVSQSGQNLKWALSHWKRDYDIVKTAIATYPLAIRYAPHFQNHKELALLAVKGNGLAMLWIKGNLCQDPDIIEAYRKNLPQRNIVAFRQNNGPLSSRIFLPHYCELADVYTIPCYNNLVPVELQNDDHSCFLRDSQVTLFNGEHLVPYSLSVDELEQRVFCALPPLSTHFVFRKDDRAFSSAVNKVYTGKGFLQENVAESMLISVDNDLNFVRGKTCIESGNCLLYKDKQTGDRKAIVGWMSVTVSLIALEEQGLFSDLDVSETLKPSATAFKMARNQDLYRKKSAFEAHREEAKKTEKFDRTEWLFLSEFGGKLGFTKSLTSPVSKEDRDKFLDEARLCQAKLDLTMQLMAKELKIPLKNIAFVPQSKFHIDMEMGVTPEGNIRIHDDALSLQFLNALTRSKKLNEEEMLLIDSYKETAEKGARLYARIKRKQLEILKKHSEDCVLFPGVFESTVYKTTLNYCNGIFVRDCKQIYIRRGGELRLRAKKTETFTYVTTGPSLKAECVVHNQFIRLFRNLFPNTNFYGINRLSRFVFKCFGGIRCLTLEERLSCEI